MIKRILKWIEWWIKGCPKREPITIPGAVGLLSQESQEEAFDMFMDGLRSSLLLVDLQKVAPAPPEPIEDLLSHSQGQGSFEILPGQIPECIEPEKEVKAPNPLLAFNPAPRMTHNPFVAHIWDKLSPEQKIWGEIFDPQDCPDIPGKLYYIRWPQYWLEA